jgi:4-amino-4-deoxy-L-arabinose transferase-like glycosyltransferase
VLVPRRAALIAACVAALLILPGLGLTPLVDWDESIYAAVSLGVLENGPFRLEWNGERYDRKPPLLFWAMALSYRFLGVSEASARAPSALAGIATVGLAAWAAARRAGLVAGLAAPAFLLGSELFLERGGRRACTDALVIAFSMGALVLAQSDRRRSRRRWGAGGAVGLAILSKGAVGLLAPASLWLAGVTGRDREQRRSAVWIGTVGLVLASPWYVYRIVADGSAFLATHFGREIMIRVLQPIHGTGAPWWYPLWVLWRGGGPWVVLAFGAAAASALADRSRRPETAPWIIAAILVLGVSMAMQTKLPWYPLAVLPMLAVSGSIALGGALLAEDSRIAVALRVGFALIALATLSTAGRAREDVLAGEREFEDFRRLGTRVAAIVAEEPFIGATEEHPSLVFYGGRPIRRFGADELDRLVLDPKALPRTALVPAEHAGALLAAGAVELGRLGDRVLVRRGASSEVLSSRDVQAARP